MTITTSELNALASRMARLFQGNQSLHYTADFLNITIEENGKRVPRYADVPGEPTEAEYLAHLKGERGLLVIPITKAGACRWGKVDVDEYPVDPKKYAATIARLGLPLIVEISKSGGVHLAHYAPFTLMAAEMRAKLADWAAALRCPPKVEIFPKQDRLIDGDAGSGINLPYFGGDAAKNYAIDKDGNRLTVDQWLTVAGRMPEVARQKTTVVDVEGVPALLAQHWTDGQRDNLNLAVAGALLRSEIPADTVQEILDASSDIASDGASRKTAERVARDIAAGKRVPGFKVLVGLIGPEHVQELKRLAGLESYTDPEEPFPIDLVMSAAQFIALSLPARDPIINGLLYGQSLVEIYGFRGSGKTWFGLAAAKAISEATPFLLWHVPTARRTLYVDGEMAGRDLQDRLKGIFGSSIPQKFELMASEVFYRTTDSSLAINDPLQQKRFVGLLEDLRAAGRDPEVIIFDNLSALTVGIDENSSTEFQTLKAWFTQLRHMNYTVIFVHHTGKSGDQRGTSAREDNLDMTIQLSEPESRTDVTRIIMRIGKCRGERPRPDELEIALVADEARLLHLAQTVEAKKPRDAIEQKFHILKFIAERSGAVTRADISKQFDIGKSTANTHVQKLINVQLVSGASGPLTATRSGFAKVSDLWPGELPL